MRPSLPIHSLRTSVSQVNNGRTGQPVAGSQSSHGQKSYCLALSIGSVGCRWREEKKKKRKRKRKEKFKVEQSPALVRIGTGAFSPKTARSKSRQRRSNYHLPSPQSVSSSALSWLTLAIGPGWKCARRRRMSAVSSRSWTQTSHDLISLQLLRTALRHGLRGVLFGFEGQGESQFSVLLDCVAIWVHRCVGLKLTTATLPSLYRPFWPATIAGTFLCPRSNNSPSFLAKQRKRALLYHHAFLTKELMYVPSSYDPPAICILRNQPTWLPPIPWLEVTVCLFFFQLTENYRVS